MLLWPEGGTGALGVQQTLDGRSRRHRCCREARCVRKPTPGGPGPAHHPRAGSSSPRVRPRCLSAALPPSQAVVSGRGLAARQHLALTSGRAMGLPRHPSSGVVLGGTRSLSALPALEPSPAGSRLSWVSAKCHGCNFICWSISRVPAFPLGGTQHRRLDAHDPSCVGCGEGPWGLTQLSARPPEVPAASGRTRS